MSLWKTLARGIDKNDKIVYNVRSTLINQKGVSMYNYRDKIKVSTTPNGDKVITMTKEIYTALLNYVFDANEHHTEHDRQATSYDVMAMWKALNDEWEYK